MDATNAKEIFRAYRAGLLRSQGGEAGRKASYQRLLSLVVWDRLPLQQRMALRRIERASWQGLCAAREGDPERAKRCFKLGQEELDRAGIALECRLLGSSTLESARAYLDYREGSFEQARRRTFAAMDADSALEQDDAFSVLEFHRLQAAHNLMRIDLRVGSPERALALFADILGYLEGQTDGLPVHGPWRKRALEQAPRLLRRTMIAQVANEAAVALTDAAGAEGWLALYENVKAWLYACRGAIHPRVLQWIKVKAALTSKDWQGYLCLLFDFLPLGREDISSVWYSCVIEFLDLCRTQDFPFPEISKEILRDAVQWPAVPPVLRSCLTRYQ